MAGKTLSEQIYDDLYHDITRQQLRCGQKLTLNMLKERFHVSHTPIREALMRLAENGLVTYYSNCGVTVIEFEERDIQELYQFASELDALAIQFCSASLNQMPLVLDLQEIIENGCRFGRGRYIQVEGIFRALSCHLLPSCAELLFRSGRRSSARQTRAAVVYVLQR